MKIIKLLNMKIIKILKLFKIDHDRIIKQLLI